MADRRTTIGVGVDGQDDLKNLNATLGEYEKHLKEVARLQRSMSASSNTAVSSFDKFAEGTRKAREQVKDLHREVGYFHMGLRQMSTEARSGATGIGRIGQETQKTSTALRDGSRDAKAYSLSFGDIAKAAGGVQLMGAAVREVTKATRESVQAMIDYDYQAARVMRVVPKANREQLLSQMRLSAAETGRGAGDQGEAQYQLGTVVKDPQALAEAHANLMKLVVGTESDVRDSARATVTMFYQYGDAIKEKVSEGEKLRRMQEMLAISWRQSNTEVQEQIESLKYLGPVAAAAKVPLEQVLGVIGALDKAGIRGSMGGTSPAQMISNLISKYDEKEQGVVYKGKTYHFDLVRTKEGGMDIVATLKDIYARVEKMAQQDAEKFMRAISGSERSFRSVAALRAALEDMDGFVKNLKDGLDGKTRVVDELNKKMQDTFGNSLARLWQGTLATMSTAFDNFASRIHLKDFLNEVQEAQRGFLELDRLNKQTQEYYANKPKSQRYVTLAGNVQNVIEYLQENNTSNKSDLDISAIGRAGLQPAEANAILGELRTRKLTRKDSFYNSELFSGTDLKKLKEDLLYEAKANRLADQEQSVVERGKKMESRLIDTWLNQYADRYGVPRNVVNAIALQESGKRQLPPNAWKAQGVMQLTPGTAQSLGVNAAVTEQNIKGGVMYLAQLKRQLGTWERVYMGYYAGAGAVLSGKAERMGRQGGGQYPSPREYAAEVMAKIKSDSTSPNVTDSMATLEKKRKAAELASRRAATAAKKGRKRSADEMEAELDYLLRDGLVREGAMDLAKEIDAARFQDMTPAQRLRAKYEIRGSAAYRVKHAVKEFWGSENATFAPLSWMSYGAFSPERLRKRAEHQYEQEKRFAEFLESDAAPYGVLSAMTYGTFSPERLQRRGAYLFGEEQRRKEIYAQNYEASRGLHRLYQDDVFSRMESRLGDVRRGERPNALFQDAEQNRLTMLEREKAIIEETLPNVSYLSENWRRVNEMLRDTTVAIRDAKDALRARDYGRWKEDLQREGERGRFDIEMSRTPVLSANRDAQMYREVGMEIALTQRELGKMQAKMLDLSNSERVSPEGRRLGDEIEQKARDLRRLEKQRADIPRERYLNMFENLRGMVVQESVSFLRGRGGDPAKALGDTVVNTILENWIKRATDPLVGQIAGQVLAIQDNTTHIEKLTQAYQQAMSDSRSGMGVEGGLGKAMGLKPNMSSEEFMKWMFGISPSKARGAGAHGPSYNNGLSQALGAYSLFQQGMQPGGTSLGGLIGAGVAGATLFKGLGPWGAVAGIGLDLLGGLFGKKKKDPLETAKNVDPAYFNSPSQFSYWAYRYRATGQLPTPEQLGMKFANATPPVMVTPSRGATVNLTVNIDGMKQSAIKAVTRQIGLDTTAYSTNVDMRSL